MIKFRQLIKPGQDGRDIKAVKRAMRKMHVKNSGALVVNKHAGHAFVTCIKTIQRNHGLKVDGIYGPTTHGIIAPHFDIYGRYLYRTARIRKAVVPPLTSKDAQVFAKQLLTYNKEGKYHADNSGDLYDIQRTAIGLPVWSQGGYWVHIDYRPLKLLCALIAAGHKIGTYAICSDHHYDGPHGHSGGLAVDISSIDGKSVASYNAKTVTLNLAKKIHNMPGDLRPWQEICGGYGNHRDSEISAQSIPAADSFYGSVTMYQHCNHIHVGYLK
jgi:hypothetical protein